MITEKARIGSQLKRAYQGEAWHGPSLRELLEGVTAEQAAAKPFPKIHSIWELVNHIITWEEIARRRLEGDPVSQIPDEYNFPPVTDTGEAAWQAALNKLGDGNKALREAIRNIEDKQLEETAPGTNYSNYFMLHGVIQHDLYH